MISLSSLAEADLKKLTLPNNRVMTITGHPDYPPVIWFNKKTNQFQGVGVELIEIILKEVNIKPVFINVETWGRAQEEVKSGRIDMLLPPYKTNERLAFFNYAADAFLQDETVIFVKKGKEFKFDKLSDLLKYPGVAIINDSFGKEFDELDQKSKHITRLTTTEQCFRFVDIDRAHYVIAGLNSGLSVLMKSNWEDKYVYLPKRIIVTGLYAPISLKSPWNTPQVNAFLKRKFDEYNRSGLVKRLEKKYLAMLKKEK